MQNKKDLIESIKGLDGEVVTDNLSKEQLSDLLSELREKIDVEAVGGTLEADEQAKLESDNDESNRSKFYVCRGKAITSKRGILADGDEIKAEYLAGGEESLEYLVKSGYVGK